MMGIKRLAVRASLAATAAAVMVAGVPLSASAARGDITIDDVTLAEGHDGATAFIFSVTYAGRRGARTVDWATADGTATAGDDYVPGSGTLSFGGGRRDPKTLTVAIEVVSDGVCEDDDVFYVELSNNTSGAIIKRQGVGTILDDDCNPGDPGDPGDGPITSSLTLKTRLTQSRIVARGVLEPATETSTVRVTLKRRQAGTWVLVRTKLVTVDKLDDRDGDGIDDAAYRATFRKPEAGRYRVVARFSGAETATKTAVAKTFRISA